MRHPTQWNVGPQHPSRPGNLHGAPEEIRAGILDKIGTEINGLAGDTRPVMAGDARSFARYLEFSMA